MLLSTILTMLKYIRVQLEALITQSSRLGDRCKSSELSDRYINRHKTRGLCCHIQRNMGVC